MSWFQTMICNRLHIPEERIRAFIADVLTNKWEFNAYVDDPVRGMTSRRVCIDGWVFVIDNDSDGEIYVAKYPERSDTSNDDAVMAFIAEYVDDGYIEMVSDTGSLWQWAFRDGKVHLLLPEIVWPELKTPELKMGFVGGRYIPIEDGEKHG